MCLCVCVYIRAYVKSMYSVRLLYIIYVLLRHLRGAQWERRRVKQARVMKKFQKTCTAAYSRGASLLFLSVLRNAVIHHTYLISSPRSN